MKHLAGLLSDSAEYKQILRGVRSGVTPQLAVGLGNIHKALYICALSQSTDRPIHVVAPNEPTALRLCQDLNALFGGAGARLFPSREFVFREVEGVSREYEHARLSVLGAVARRECRVVVSTAEGAVQHTIPEEVLRAHTRTLRTGESHSVESLTAFLVEAGYTFSQQVEGPAQFAVRGGILDVYPPDSPRPLRIEFWGDEIDTISEFDAQTQRRLEAVEEARITPAREAVIGDKARFRRLLEEQKEALHGKYGKLAKEAIDRDLMRLEDDLGLGNADKYFPLLYPSPQTVLDYCREWLLVVCEPMSIRETLKSAGWQEQEDIGLLLGEGVLFKGCDTFSLDYVDLARHMQRQTTVILDTFARAVPEVPLKSTVSIQAIQLSAWSGEYSFLLEDVKSYLERGYCVAVCAGTERACAALESDLTRDGIRAHSVKEFPGHAPGTVFLLASTLSAGAEIPDLRFALIAHSQSIPTVGRRRKKRGEGKRIKALSDLHPGDYVVHSGHGIGVFEGIVKRDMHGVTKDYIKIKYAGTDTLFVPVTQLDLVSKYIGGAEGVSVRLNRLNSVEWQKTRARVKSAVKDMAKELTQLYADRMSAKGYEFSSDSEWQREFEGRFPFEETEDQLRCVEEIKGDMQKPAPMDRLLCGDVGFGKTEVALRAVFKCVLDGKQCAVLVPTTILAWQHYQTFTRRLSGYPVQVELLSRFKTPKEQEDIIRRLKTGEVDIVIGTHRVVQKDIVFKDLGLCIIDEEQRFGVAHKEKFKEMRGEVDVLTLSATPIPRTLSMAMGGIRDMSIIEEAPQDRYPVQTYVLEHDMGVLCQAIQKELRRGGQVFYLHNRIESIDSCAGKLRELLPEARIVTAHGKLGEEQLSLVWQQLVEQEIDILVCTTIIETGVDVPNCNTLIIEDADRMGLSQLYQIRGRVGRSTRRAYAYLTFHRGKMLSDVAGKRLAAIREFTSFGSGFRIAMRDLEIRGAGNILGAQQHGHMEAVGYDLYLRLLSEAVSEERGEDTRPATECAIDIRLDAHIPERYIPNLSQRIDIYKKIAAVATGEDALDVTDELIDRFGDPPQSVKGLVDVALIRNTAAGLGIREISQKDGQMIFYPEVFQIEQAAAVAARMRGRVLVNAGNKPYLSVKIPGDTDPVDTIREALANMGS